MCFFINYKNEQESISYLNLSSGPWDHGSLGPWDPWTLDSLTLEPFPSSTTSSYFLLPPPISSFGMVWLWGGVVTLEDEIGDGPLIDLKKLWGGWVEP